MESYSMEKSNEPALTVRGAYKRYSPTSIVLKGLNMNVPQGTIYGLLGPSGCGKTTLLNCIVGRVELDAGEIQTRAKIKADVGYMPQDVALYSTLSIEETFLYYGRLFGLSHKNVQIRTSELISLLELPPEKSVIDNLSGGQQRRVSFAVALLHNPQLLILDEPTVGLDPLLSQSIWEHLVKLTSDRQKTIIITTHYIEEARQAHTVGLMRGGMLLAEESPSQLMLSHNCSTLEQAFLELSHKQCATSGDDDEDSSELETNYPSPSKPRPKPHLKSGGWFSWSRFMAQLIKNLFFMWRNKPMMLFLLGLPLVQCTLYNLAIGRDPEGLHIAIVDLELPGGLAQCNNVALTGCNLTMPLSCRYIYEIQQRNLILVEYSDLMSAQQSLRWNKAWAVLHFAHNYSDTLLERVTYGRDTSNTSVELSNVDVWMDMSNQYIGNLLKADLISCYVDFLQGVFRDCGWPPQAANIPIRTEEPVYGLRKPKFIHFASPAVILVFMFYLPMMFTVSVILQEKMAGILERAMVAGVTVLEVIMAHSVVQFVVLLIQTAIMMAVMYRLFDSPFLGSFFWTTNLLLLQGLSGMCFGFLVSVACDSMSTASFMGLGSFFPLCSMSGMLWPQEGMHYFLQTIAWILPMSLSTEAMRALTARGWQVDHPSVYKGFISTSAWIIIFCFATRLVVKFKKGMKGK